MTPSSNGRRPRRAIFWGLGTAAAGAVAAAAIAVAVLAGGSDSSAGGHANLAADSTPLSATASTSASPTASSAANHQARRAARRHLFRRAEHGQVTYAGRKGTRTVALERGTVTTTGSGTVTVRAADGTAWTWHLTSHTVVRRDHGKVAASELAAGEKVSLRGPVTSGNDQARFIHIRAAAGTGSSS